MNEQDRLDAGIPEQGRGSSRMPILCILEMDTRQQKKKKRVHPIIHIACFVQTRAYSCPCYFKTL